MIQALWFGSMFHFDDDIVGPGDRAGHVADCLATFSKSAVSYQTLAAGSDRFSRSSIWRAGSEKRLKEISEHSPLQSVVFHSEVDRLGSASLGVQVKLDASKQACREAVMAAPYADMSCDTADGVAICLATALSARYGYSLFGGSAGNVTQELTGTPVQDWRSPVTASEEERLFRLQRARPELGRTTRPNVWSTVLGDHLVAQLGGAQSVISTAPAEEVRQLANGSLYFRLFSRPVAVGTPEFAARQEDFKKFMGPILSAQLSE